MTRLHPDYVANCLDLDRRGEPAPGGWGDEWPDPVGTVPLACGHMGVPTVQHITREDAYWCPTCQRYEERE